jgi:hypothetical protein
MDLSKLHGPKYVNRDFHTEEKFPMVVGFCDRDESSHVITKEEERYDYKLDSETVYRLIRTKKGWEVIEYAGGKKKQLSEGSTLGGVLYHALIETGEDLENRCRIIVPVRKDGKDKALSLMYYFGGYTGSWLSDEVHDYLRKKHTAPPDLVYLCFSKVPGKYVHWLAFNFSELDISAMFSVSVMQWRKAWSIQLPDRNGLWYLCFVR